LIVAEVAEVVVLAFGGLGAGAAVGWLLSQVLVAVLTGVFDPSPAAFTVPWHYLHTRTRRRYSISY
jgi:putative ABC transport system permease protein